MRKTVTAVLVTLAFLALLESVAADPLPQFVGEPAETGSAAGRAFEWFDPTGEIRAEVDPEVADRLIARIRRESRRSESWAQAMFESLAVASSELRSLESRGDLDTKARPAIGAVTMMAVVDTLVEMYPELASRAAARARDGESPIEKMCDCDRRGSRACGCVVLRTGFGGCQYYISCATIGRAFCSAVNFEMCVAREVIGVFWPIA